MPDKAKYMGPDRRKDHNDTVRDLKALLMAEVRDHPGNDDLVRRILKSVDELADQLKDQAQEIISLRLKAEHTVPRTEVEKIAKDATEVAIERVNNLWKFVTVSHTFIGAVLLFIATKLFKA